MNRTSIEWVLNPDGSRPGWSWSPITGCRNQVNGLCKGGGFPCYAYKLAHTRLKQRYLANTNTAVDITDLFNPVNVMQRQVKSELNPFYPRWWEEKLDQPMTKKSRWGNNRLVVHSQSRKGIFVCDMSDLFGVGVPENWTRLVLAMIKDSPQHRFYLLTKQPQRLPEFSPFPENCWVGVTATGRASLKSGFWHLAGIDAKVKYLSLEPLLEEPPTGSLLACVKGVNWLIIGACTGTGKEMATLCQKYPQLTPTPWGNRWTAQPQIQWVREIVEAADKGGVEVFLKDNLGPLGLPLDSLYYSQYETKDGPEYRLRQEMPK